MSDIHMIDSLKQHPYRAMQLEHSTIPTYLTALYSLHPQTKSDAYHVLRATTMMASVVIPCGAFVHRAPNGDGVWSDALQDELRAATRMPPRC